MFEGYSIIVIIFALFGVVTFIIGSFIFIVRAITFINNTINDYKKFMYLKKGYDSSVFFTLTKNNKRHLEKYEFKEIVDNINWIYENMNGIVAIDTSNDVPRVYFSDNMDAMAYKLFISEGGE